MNTETDDFSEQRKKELIDLLTNELKVLRAKLEISQQDLANRIGITRQTYGMIEKKKHHMTWNHFMALIFVFLSNEGSKELLAHVGGYPPDLDKYVRLNKTTNNIGENVI